MHSVIAERAGRAGRCMTWLARSMLLAAIVAGCRLPSDALDGPLAVPLRITVTLAAVEVDAPGWFAADTAVYLCPTEPPALPEPGPDREGWTPGSGCHDYGRFAAPDGLRATLPLDALPEADRPAFDAADNWYLLIVKVEGARATAAIHSNFSAPSRPGS